MSGHCDFCQIWHSASCCHPGRAKLIDLESQLTASEANEEKQRNTISILEARLARLELVELAEAKEELRYWLDVGKNLLTDSQLDAGMPNSHMETPRQHLSKK